MLPWNSGGGSSHQVVSDLRGGKTPSLEDLQSQTAKSSGCGEMVATIHFPTAAPKSSIAPSQQVFLSDSENLHLRITLDGLDQFVNFKGGNCGIKAISLMIQCQNSPLKSVDNGTFGQESEAKAVVHHSSAVSSSVQVTAIPVALRY